MPLVLLAILLAQAKPTLPEADAIVKECARAFEAKDRGWFERRMAPAFVYRDLEGETKGRAQALDRIEGWFHPLGYRVGLSLTLVSARRTKDGLRIVGDLKARSQLLGWRRMPLTETTVRVSSSWRLQRGTWMVDRMDEVSSKKTVDGKEVEP